MLQDDNKKLILKAQAFLKGKGHEVKTSHLYDLFSQLAGHKNWHVASKAEISLADTVKSFTEVPKKVTGNPEFLKHVSEFLINEQNEEEKFELFDPELFAWNYSLSGERNSGKSVMTNKILYNQVLQHKNPMIFILDNVGDKTYAKFTELNKGSEINFKKGLPKINLLDLDLENSVASDAKVEKIKKYLSTNNPTYFDSYRLKMLIEDNFYEISNSTNKKEVFLKVFMSEDSGFKYDEACEKFFSFSIGEAVPTKSKLGKIYQTLLLITNADMKEEDAMMSIILSCYNKIGESSNRLPKIYDVISEIKNSSDISTWMLNFALALEDFNKRFPDLFDSETTLDLNNNIIWVDFSALSTQKRLQEIYYYLIEEKIQYRLFFTKNKCKLIVRDGVLSILRENDALMKSIRDEMRTSRKNGFATILISHSINELLGSRANQYHIVSNISAYIIGKQFISKNFDDFTPSAYADQIKNLLVDVKLGSNFIIVKDKKAKAYTLKLKPEEFSLYCAS